MKIFVISLAKDKHKKLLMKEQFDKLGIKNYEFIDAIYGNDLDESEIRKVYRKTHRRALTKGEIGCALSHLKAYKKMEHQNLQDAIIFEDDVTLDKDFMDVLEGLAKHKYKLDRNALLHFYPSAVIYKNSTVADINTKYTIKKGYKSGGAWAYYLTLPAAKELIKSCKKITMPIDIIPHRLLKRRKLTKYCISPACVSISEYFLENSNLNNERHIATHNRNWIAKVWKKTHILEGLRVIRYKIKGVYKN